MKQILTVGWVFFASTIFCFAQRSIKIDLTNQEAYLLDRGRVILRSPICSGRPGHETPVGKFKVTDKDINHASSFYGFLGNPATKQIVVPDADIDMNVPTGLEFVQAPMRYYVQFQPAIGLHAGFLPGRPASHGCVRMPEEYAAAFFQAATVGMPVIVYGSPQSARVYWASRHTGPSGFRHLAAFGYRGNRAADHAAFKRNRHAAFEQFETEWDIREKALERQIDATEGQEDRATGSRKEELQAQAKRLQRLKDDFDFQRGAAREALEREWGG
jgi:hypothetical protein